MTGISPLGSYGYYTTSGTGSSKDSDSNLASAAAGTVDKTEFLRLLVTQLQNQDPLNPIKNDDFVAQMATFSSLEQLISINKAVTQLADDNGASTKTDEAQQKRA